MGRDMSPQEMAQSATQTQFLLFATHLSSDAPIFFFVIASPYTEPTRGEAAAHVIYHPSLPPSTAMILGSLETHPPLL